MSADTSQRTPDVKRAAGSRKDPLQYLPPEFLRLTARALKSGADKYGRMNWRLSGLHLDTYIGALLRHTLAMSEGEWLDPDSGLPHAAMIAANAAVLIDCDLAGLLEGKSGPVPEQITPPTGQSAWRGRACDRARLPARPPES